MGYRYFELTELTPIEDERELHAQFVHHLQHVLKAEFIPGTKGKNIVIEENEGKSIPELFGGHGDKFLILYDIDEYFKF
ncbi:TPA: hypothetical protein OPR04_004492 [Citrobacter koseri]|uniref:hypothetical protein n=1 Tax=Citrobacter TaxID=544 RepID=UPI00254F64B1|nr:MULTISPECIES: hypothetical protein [Citrobacter]MDK6747523.1 hypothetical protein [Citrobacter sp. UMB8248A]MDK8127111.1 hypothetical protein [Citrobacter koseri]HCR9734433.1 hypothetical protein [Citrobacter koseri]